MGFESVLPSPLLGIGGAGVSMDGHGAESTGGSPPPPSMTTIPSEIGNPSLVSLSGTDSADFRVEAFPSLPADNIHKDRVCPPLAVDVVVEYPWKPGQGESTPAPQRPKTLRKSPSKPKPSGRPPPSAPTVGLGEGLSPKRVANTAEAGAKIASAVSTSNAFAALQNPEDSILPEEPQGIPPRDSDCSSRDQSFPACDPPILEEVQLVEIPPGPSSTNMSSATRSSRSVARRVPIEEPHVRIEKDVRPPKLMAVLAPRAYSKSAVPKSGIDCATGRSETMKSREPGIERTSLVVPGADLQPHQLFDHSETNVPPVPYADALNCGLGIPPPATDEFPVVDSVDQSLDASPFKALVQAPSLKVVRFAPEILSAEASSCAPHRNMLAPRSDICHPVKFFFFGGKNIKAYSFHLTLAASVYFI
ncbi:hypothetical protein Nepgr_003858 [Nepenthes gracilis]|uniref:Uncharacterized protein n=1 Tax=Nepenthes gracilis TaxID=150966 RepID=A0AAD3S0A4_NEPGR|nr:hypothetical protein Nepgr_003858 [Nepenthes gracilis]